jgi:hypothetical protein
VIRPRPHAGPFYIFIMKISCRSESSNISLVVLAAGTETTKIYPATFHSFAIFSRNRYQHLNSAFQKQLFHLL